MKTFWKKKLPACLLALALLAYWLYTLGLFPLS